MKQPDRGTIDMLGVRAGHVVVIERAGANLCGLALWKYRCEFVLPDGRVCGKLGTTDGGTLRRASPNYACADCRVVMRRKPLGHKRAAPKRDEPAGPVRLRAKVCSLCYGLPHRVDGDCCLMCGLRGAA
jgi:hypothetical protein